MVLAISSTLTKGLNVLGPGRITRSTGSSGSDSKLLGPEPEHHALLARDDAGVPSDSNHPTPHVPHGLVECARRNVTPHHIDQSGPLGVRSLGGKPRPSNRSRSGSRTPR